MVMHGATAAMESVAEAGVQDDGQGHLQQEDVGRPDEGAGPGVAQRGLESFSRDSQWVDNRDFIFERSAEMRHRMNEIERDVREQLRDIHIKLGPGHWAPCSAPSWPSRCAPTRASPCWTWPRRCPPGWART
jgi:hypothetical protein